MGIDKLKLAGSIKIFAFISYLIYFFTYNSILIENLPNDKGNFFEKIMLENKCLLIIGGSNVRQGVSAELLSTKDCESVNLGFNAEMGSVDKYLSSLSVGTKVEKIIYSSGNIWDSNNFFEESAPNIKIPSISLFTMVSYLFGNPQIIYSPNGDLKEYNCNPITSGYIIDVERFSNSNKSVTSEVYRRILILKDKFHLQNIFFRVPPIYVENENQAVLYTDLMRKRVEMLKGLGVKMVGSTIVSTDSSLFCDSFHPNARGREEFTKEIILP